MGDAIHAVVDWDVTGTDAVAVGLRHQKLSPREQLSMSERNTLLRSMHDVGAAAWFGGSLMGAVGLNGGASDVADPADRARVSAAGWARWAPVQAAAIGVHAIGGLGLILANKCRASAQAGAGANTVVKTALTATAAAATSTAGCWAARSLKQDKSTRRPPPPRHRKPLVMSVRLRNSWARCSGPPRYLDRVHRSELTDAGINLAGIAHPSTRADSTPKPGPG